MPFVKRMLCSLYHLEQEGEDAHDKGVHFLAALWYFGIVRKTLAASPCKRRGCFFIKIGYVENL